jgi:hypothetical protein
MTDQVSAPQQTRFPQGQFLRIRERNLISTTPAATPATGSANQPSTAPAPTRRGSSTPPPPKHRPAPAASHPHPESARAKPPRRAQRPRQIAQPVRQHLLQPQAQRLGQPRRSAPVPTATSTGLRSRIEGTVKSQRSGWSTTFTRMPLSRRASASRSAQARSSWATKASRALAVISVWMIPPRARSGGVWHRPPRPRPKG